MPKFKSKSTNKKGSYDLFNKHKNLKWLIPILILAFLFLLFVHHAREELGVNMDTSVYISHNKQLNVANWQTYTDLTNGFSFKYPDNWIKVDDPTTENGPQVSFFLKTDPQIVTTETINGTEQLMLNVVPDSDTIQSLLQEFPHYININGKEAACDVSPTKIYCNVKLNKSTLLILQSPRSDGVKNLALITTSFIFSH